MPPPGLAACASASSKLAVDSSVHLYTVYERSMRWWVNLMFRQSPRLQAWLPRTGMQGGLEARCQ